LQQSLFFLHSNVFGVVTVASAWTYFGQFTNNSNWWDPNGGEKWGQFYITSDRRLHADTSNVWWDSSRANQIKNGGIDPATVFHIFKKNGNCDQKFSFTGYWWSNIAGTYNPEKWADCSRFTV